MYCVFLLNCNSSTTRSKTAEFESVWQTISKSFECKYFCVTQGYVTIHRVCELMSNENLSNLPSGKAFAIMDETWNIAES